jgi:hypothetical protein
MPRQGAKFLEGVGGRWGVRSEEWGVRSEK